MKKSELFKLMPESVEFDSFDYIVNYVIHQSDICYDTDIDENQLNELLRGTEDSWQLSRELAYTELCSLLAWFGESEKRSYYLADYLEEYFRDYVLNENIDELFRDVQADYFKEQIEKIHSALESMQDSVTSEDLFSAMPKAVEKDIFDRVLTAILYPLKIEECSISDDKLEKLLYATEKAEELAVRISSSSATQMMNWFAKSPSYIEYLYWYARKHSEKLGSDDTNIVLIMHEAEQQYLKDQINEIHKALQEFIEKRKTYREVKE